MISTILGATVELIWAIIGFAAAVLLIITNIALKYRLERAEVDRDLYHDIAMINKTAAENAERRGDLAIKTAEKIAADYKALHAEYSDLSDAFAGLAEQLAAIAGSAGTYSSALGFDFDRCGCGLDFCPNNSEIESPAAPGLIVEIVELRVEITGRPITAEEMFEALAAMGRAA